MIRKLILPAAAVLLLAGCATGYTYRTAPGDYYHGQAGVIYRDYYGYPGYRTYYSPYNWTGYYGYRSGYRYGYPYYRWRHDGHHHQRPDEGHDGGGDHTPDRAAPPWRDLGRISERRSQNPSDARPRPRPQGNRPAPPQQPRPQVQQRPQTQRPTRIDRPAPTRRPTPVRRPPVQAPVRSGGSRMSELIDRARSK